MFKKILIANRGDQPHSGAACTGGFAAEVAHV